MSQTKDESSCNCIS